jgi:hypothetical protein
MAFTEDLSVFVADFGVPVSAAGRTGLGILDMPSEMVADGVVLTTDYQLTVVTSDFGSFTAGDSVTVDGVSYKVRSPELIDDGKFTKLMLMRT